MRRYASQSLRYYHCVVCRYSLNAAALEQRFFDDVGELSADEGLVRRWVETPRLARSDASAIARELADLERDHSEEATRRKRDRLFDLAMSTSLDDLEFKRQIRRIEDERAAAGQRMAALRLRLDGDETRGRDVTRARQLLAAFRPLYDAAEYDEKRELVAALAAALGGAEASLGRPAVDHTT